ncbi:MAG: hypothetical protein M1834_007468 [Cirrosporium novae-zelandiae]|nr:MAG: hypothetical protein M1834_007468 [Cirrosporium novae-zelandiae]
MDNESPYPTSSGTEEEKKEEPVDVVKVEKDLEIERACQKSDIKELITLATSKNGLGSDTMRRIAWPILLGSALEGLKIDDAWKYLPRHKDEDQVKLDVDRSFIYYPSDQSEKQLAHSKEQLSALITRTLRCHPTLSYFQGYHDIVQVLLLVLGPALAFPALERLSLLRIRDYMLPDLDPALAHLKLIPAILVQADTKLYKHLSHTQPFFALAATLTLYAHDIEEYGDIARLFDFLIAHEAIITIYLFVAIVLSRKSELLGVPLDEPEMLHSILSKLPKPLDLEVFISRTMELYTKFPPESLPWGAWRQISLNSVLKTTRDPLARQTLEDGEWFLEEQKIELRWQKRRADAIQLMKKYKRPAVSIGMAVLVAILAYWLRKSGTSAPIFAFLAKKWSMLKPVLWDMYNDYFH